MAPQPRKQYKKIICAYSGGLDTSVMVPWLKEHYGAEIITYTGNLGQNEDLPRIREKALRTGAQDAVVEDLRDTFVTDYIWPALQGGALYEGVYPLHTALGRPLLVARMVAAARACGADAIAHGCTGKGNDQIRFEVGFRSLAPDLGIIAPLREWELTTRELEIDYAIANNIEVPITKAKPYSIDQNIWGSAIECGELEDLWNEPPEDAWLMTQNPLEAPHDHVDFTLDFEQGLPVAIDDKRLEPVTLVEQLNQLAGKYGIGRIDMVENRVVGLKSRELYEAPSATILHTGHREIERMTLDPETFHYKQKVSFDMANVIYRGTWFSPLRESLHAFVQQTQRYVTGTVRLRASAGKVPVLGRKSPYSLYDMGLATYSAGDTFDRDAARGFMELYGLAYKTVGQVQGGSNRGDT